MDNKIRNLIADDFIALRSLAQASWIQSELILWKFNRTWCSVSFTDVPALEATNRLEKMGLVLHSNCCSDCLRAAIKLTDRGRAFCDRLNEN
jgi:hypothetical protein